MKKLLNVAAILIFSIYFMGFGVRALAEEDAEYRIFFENDEYLLCYTDEGNCAPIFAAKSLSAVLERIYALSPRAVIIFSDISSAESIYLKSGEYEIRGEIEFVDGAGMTVDGAKIRICSADITMNTASIRIKRGSVEMHSGCIRSSAQNAILLDYSSGAALSVFGGKIITSSDNSSIFVKHGTLTVSGGSIENFSGVAIYAQSTVVLSGAPRISGDDYGIDTGVPLTLSDGVSDFSGSVSVRFSEEFERGSISCIAYMATEASLSGIQLFDIKGSLKELKYFSSYKGIDETDFGAVYSPYTVEFKDNGRVIYSEYLLHGERLTLPEAPTKEGYKFIGWRYLSESGEFYEFSAPVENDTTLYACFELLKPKYELKSLSFVYDGLSRSLKFEKISHPLLSDGVISYSWYKNGKAIQNFSDVVSINGVSDSGEYYCNITFSFAGDSVSFDTVAVTVVVDKAVVQLPEIPSVRYNGKYQYADISSNGVYTVEETGGVIVGVYQVPITLSDFENYRFADSVEKSVYLDFVIEKAENVWIEELRVKDIYCGMIPSPTVKSLFGEPEFFYSVSEDGAYTNVAPNTSGVYFVKARVSGTENYYPLESAPVRFSVIEEIATGISVLALPHKMEYTAFEYFNPEGISVGVSYNSGRSEILGAESLRFLYQSEDTFRYGDTAVTVMYEDVSCTLRVTVKKAEYDVTGILFEDAVAEYDASYKTIEFLGTLPMGLDGIRLTATVVGGSSESGIHTVALVFLSESSNYNIPENMYATLTVTPREVGVTWERTSFVYDGSLKAPSAYYIDAHGRKITLKVSGGRTYVGEYTATASSADANYTLLDASVLFTVEKADYDMSEVVWIGLTQYYDGSEKRVTLTNLPDGVSVIGYLDNTATDAGEYTVTASLGYDERNYNSPGQLIASWFILPSSYETDGFWFGDTEFIYDGAAHYPSFFGEMPIGADGIVLEFEFGEGIVNATECGAVEIVFSTKSKNYLPPENMKAYVKINPKGITVSWHSLNFAYDGEVHSPYAIADEAEIFVSGGAVGAGEYTAFAISADYNYFVINSETRFVINKAENKWQASLTVNDIFYGQKPSPHAEALFGEVRYLYYSDIDATEEIEAPMTVGRYFVKALGLGDDNHLPITSDCLSFDIIAIVPVGLFVELLPYEYSAFDLISPEGFIAYLKNNDGSCVLLDVGELAVIYSSGDSLRASDKSVRFSYSDLNIDVEISVKKRDYDLSGVVWQNLIHVYDGGEKSALLSGLPEGVSVISYDGNRAVNAGEYYVSAKLDYDKENYNEPKILSALMKVEKQTVNLDEIESVIYNGKEQSPSVMDSELFIYEFSPVRDAGEYRVIFKVKDKLNYAFINGEDSISVPFSIEKRVLKVKVTDIILYLFEKEITPSYSVLEGEIALGDNLVPSYIIGDSEISVSFENCNYDVEIIPGKIERMKSLSKETQRISLIIFFVFMTGAIALAAVIINRKRLYRYYRVLLCRSAYFEGDADCMENMETLAAENSEELISKDSADKYDGEVEKNNAITDFCERDDEPFSSMINADYADGAITDSLARDLIRRDEETIVTGGYKKGIINVDTLSRSFSPGDRVDVNILKKKSLVPYDTAYIKVLARGVIDKPLIVYANDFSLSAVKMIALAGGKSVKAFTATKKNGKRK